MMQDGAMNKTCVGGIHGCPEAKEEMRSGCCGMFEANQHAQIGVGNLWLLLPRKKYIGSIIVSYATGFRSSLFHTSDLRAHRLYYPAIVTPRRNDANPSRNIYVTIRAKVLKYYCKTYRVIIQHGEKEE